MAAADPGFLTPRPARVLSRRRETDESVTIALEPAGEPWLPGQFYMLYGVRQLDAIERTLRPGPDPERGQASRRQWCDHGWAARQRLAGMRVDDPAAGLLP